MPQKKVWMIRGKVGLYTGWRHTRNSIIAEHVHDVFSHMDEFGKIDRNPGAGNKLTPEQSQAWDRAYENGDRAIRVTVTY